MSTWTDFRDKVEAVGEAVIDPVVSKGITFLHDVETLVEQQGPGDVETALGDGSAAFAAAAGTVEAKLLAGLVAYLWLAGTRFFRQVPSLSLFLLMFVVIELTLILIVRSAANASIE